MRLRNDFLPPRRDNSGALMDVVFLMLIFFLLAGTIAPPEDRTVALADALDAERIPPPQMIYMRADGTFRGPDGAAMGFAGLAAAAPDDTPLRIGADRDLPAEDLIDLLAALRAEGILDVVLVTRAGSGP